ncbi:histidine phosphatase family protein [Oceanisphaera pacifica]|uniref:Histidine phosphatase family protein n=1 Tax=Oceanisphaera pacifica TaxID=2818389 RepID=A0ABS3NEE8_9GAMM|nr:histidine phosphatase family protein [Oceanisphaera pacifica]MBO1518961.1 histidine phosphatase family protein [Oceanisphaera pacifica]
MSRTIYVLRHGQTQFNAEQRLQGHCNSDLTELGLQQANAMANTLSGLIADPKDWAIYSSPLGRAQQTAHIICEHLQLPADHIQLDKRLMEVGLGEWEQLRAPDLQLKFPHISQAVLDWYLQAPKAERFVDAKQRLNNWLQDPKLPQQVIVIGHGLSGAILRGLYAGLEYHEIWQQSIPQNAFFKLHHGQVTRITC